VGSELFHANTHDEANSRFSQFCERAFAYLCRESKKERSVIQPVPCSQYADSIIPANTLPLSPEMPHRLHNQKFHYSVYCTFTWANWI
jgi:hypothetical protein